MKPPEISSKSIASLEDEAGLLRRLKEGDPTAQAWLVEAHRERLYRAAVHFLGWRDPDAEDVVQETFFQAFKHIDGFGGRSQLYTWLNQICARLCFRRLRQRQRLALGAEADLRDSLRLPSRGTDALHQLLGAEQRGLLQRGLEALQERCREIVERRDLKGEAYAAAAAALKLPLGTFMSRLARCRAQLRAWVKEQG